jgi:signal transduction histidine kinase
MDVRRMEILAVMFMLIPLYIVAITSSDTFENQMETAAVSNLRARVYGTLSLLDGYRTMVDGGMMTEAEALGWISRVLCGPEGDAEEGIKIGERGYMTVWDYSGRTLISPARAEENREENPDLYEAIAARSEGLYRYTTRSTPAEEKIVYFSRYDPWELIVGATVYAEEYRPPSLPVSVFMLIAIAAITVVLLYTVFGAFSRKRMLSIIITIVLVIVLLSTATALSSSEFYEWRESALKEEVESKARFGLAICYSFKTMVDRGMMTRDEAISRIGDIICGPRVDGGRNITKGFLTGDEGYTDIFDEDGKYLVHPFNEGRNIKDIDPERYELIIRDREGLVLYTLQGPGDPQPREKIGAFVFFEPWRLFILSTAYVDEYMQPMMTMRNYMASTIALVAFASFFSIFLSNELRKAKGNG